jgi:phospholipid/cholesterol/gamma-HCH transport system substrate-binding protein
VILTLALFVVFVSSFQDTHITSDTGYQVSAGFGKIYGLFEGAEVRLEPGSEKTYTAASSSITKTKDFRSLGDQVGDIIFLASGGDDKDE